MPLKNSPKMAYHPHPLGNYGLYGIRMLGEGPILQINGKIYKFLSFPTQSDYVCTFQDVDGNIEIIDLQDNTLEVIRMEKV